MQIQSLIKSRSDQVKKIKFADSCIPWERGAFMLHPLTYQNLAFHTLKIETSKLVKVLWKDSYLRVVFHMIMFQRVRIICSIEFGERLKDFLAFTVKLNAAKISFVHVLTIKHPLPMNLL